MKLKPTISQLTPNESLVLHKGNVHLKCEEWELDAEVNIEFHWKPKPNIRLTAVSDDRFNSLDFKRDIKLCIEAKDTGRIMPLLMKSRSINHMEATMPYYFEGDLAQEVESIRFEIPNLFTFHGDAENQINTLVLKANGFNILIQSENVHSNYSSLDGGYISNGRGEIKSLDKPLVFDNVRSTLLLLNKFLSFLHGRRVEVMFFEGYNGDNKAFKFYPVKHIDENDLPWTWFSFSLHVKDNNYLEAMWLRMYSLYQSEEDRDFVDLLMHFYAETTYNRNSGETSITIIQNALELLSSRLLVEESHIIDRTDYDKMSASSLLNVLLLWAQIPNTIPTHFRDLTAFASAYNLRTGPQAITFIRNCIVHPHLKNREKFKKISTSIKQQVLRIGIYYTELLMLKYFDYNGHYDSRFSNVDATERILVPWA